MNDLFPPLPSLTRAAASLALVCGMSALNAQTVLDFADLGPSPVGTHMVDGYAGFRWTSSNWHFMSAASNPANTFLALSGTATAIHASGGTDFLFHGADFWSRRGLDANGTFYYILHHDGVLVYDGRLDRDGRNRFTGTPSTFVPNYNGPVDTVAVAFAQGGGDWDHLAMDNFAFTVIPPASAPPPVTPPPPAPTPTPAPVPTPAPTPVTYRLAVKTNGKGSVAVSRTGSTFVAGTLLTLTATPAAGSPWLGWSGDASGLARTITVTVNRSLTIQANFK